MPELREDQLQRLNRYLDAELSPAERAEFEAELARDPHLRAAAERLGRAHAALRTHYQLADASPTRKTASPLRRLALAAGILLAVGLTFYAYRQTLPPPLDGDLIHRAFVLDPTPVIVCDTPEKFLAYTQDTLSAPITARFDTGITLVGWRDAQPGYGDKDLRTRLLLAYAADQTPVVVLFQPAGRPKPLLTRRGLQAYSLRLGPIDLWEISPLDQPVVLPVMSLVNK